MQKPEPTENEKRRLEVLRELKILDTTLEECYDEITRLAARVCETPICLISLVDEDRQWFKSRYGLDATETPREVAFCAHAIHSADLFEIPDSREDERFHDNPLVTGAPDVIFYAGQPLELEDSARVGTLCVIDNKPKHLTDDQKETLKTLARQVEIQFRLRKSLQKIAAAEERSREESVAKSNFLADMSHEIRTPMNAILGYSELLLEDPLSEEQHEKMTVISESARGLLSIVNDVLSISQIEAGKVSLQNETFALVEHLTAVVKMLGVSIKPGVELLTVFENLPDWVVSDKGKIRQIATNLLSNAMKFTTQGQVTFACRGYEENGQMLVQMTVQDTGPGIPEEKRAEIFQKYVRTERSLSHTESTGLGLPIAFGIVRVLQGELKVQSELGVGTTFDATFPVIVGQKVDEILSEQSDNLAHLKVLIVEDNVVNQNLLVERLGRFGVARVDVAMHGQEALIRVEKAEQPYSVIFMDVRMPVMDGLEATRQLRQKGVKSTILGLTGLATSEERESCLQAGMDDFLSKPITKQMLFDKIKAL